MTIKQFQIRSTNMQLRRGTAAEWAQDNPILLEAELGIETDTLVIRVGDGRTRFTDLPSIVGEGGGASALTELTDAPATLLPNKVLQVNPAGSSTEWKPKVRALVDYLDVSHTDFTDLTLDVSGLPYSINGGALVGQSIANGYPANKQSCGIWVITGITDDIATIERREDSLVGEVFFSGEKIMMTTGTGGNWFECTVSVRDDDTGSLIASGAIGTAQVGIDPVGADAYGTGAADFEQDHLLLVTFRGEFTRISTPASGTHTLKCVDGSIAWVEDA